MSLHVFSAVVAREGGRPSIPEASRLNSTVSGILDRPIKSGDDTECCSQSSLNAAARKKPRSNDVDQHKTSARLSLPDLAAAY
jgi:hypothetical protein